MWLIVRILINLYYKLYRALYYPFTLLAKRGFGLIIMAGALYLLVQVFSSDDAVKTSPAPLPQMAGEFAKPSKAGRYENGNSSFAADLISTMTPEELRYYSQTYYRVMSHQPAGKAHQWQYATMHGSITPAEVFKNNYGHRCRRFAEVLKVQNVQQKLDGIACEKVGGGWCKLGAQFAPICGLAPKSGIGAWWDRTTRDLF